MKGGMQEQSRALQSMCATVCAWVCAGVGDCVCVCEREVPWETAHLKAWA